MFALRFKDTKKMVGFYYTADADYRDNSAEITFTLHDSSLECNVWVTTSKETAQEVADGVYQYFGNYNNPYNPFLGKLEVVELTCKVTL